MHWNVWVDNVDFFEIFVQICQATMRSSLISKRSMLIFMTCLMNSNWWQTRCVRIWPSNAICARTRFAVSKYKNQTPDVLKKEEEEEDSRQSGEQSLRRRSMCNRFVQTSSCFFLLLSVRSCVSMNWSSLVAYSIHTKMSAYRLFEYSLCVCQKVLKVR